MSLFFLKFFSFLFLYISMGADAAAVAADRAPLVGRLGLVSSEKPWPLFAPSYLALTPHIYLCVVFVFSFIVRCV